MRVKVKRNPEPTAAMPIEMKNPARLAFGTMAIGGQFADVSDDAAISTIRAAIQAGIRLFDTAPQYGCGLAEERLGRAIEGIDRSRIELSTKVGKLIVPEGSGGECQRSRFFPGGRAGEMIFDYSRDGTLRAIEGSLERLGTARLDLVLIHDLIRHFHGDEGVHVRATEAMTGAIPALRDLQRQGVVGKIGVGLKDVDIAERFVREAQVEVILVPGRMTLLDQSALTSGLLNACRASGAAYIAAAPFDSGILAQGAKSEATYAYRPASDDIRTRVAAIETACARHGVPLATVALQFPLRFRGVSHVLAGMRSPAEVESNVRALNASVPDALWRDLEAAGVPQPA
ncbi:MAG: hypothetical protein RL291_550 [Pseudomonadota bacterium]